MAVCGSVHGTEVGVRLFSRGPFCHLIAAGLWSNWVTSLSLSFFSWKLGIMVLQSIFLPFKLVIWEEFHWRPELDPLDES